MFKVKHKESGAVSMVYGVDYNDSPSFLVYINDLFRMLPITEFEPFEEIPRGTVGFYRNVGSKVLNERYNFEVGV